MLSHLQRFVVVFVLFVVCFPSCDLGPDVTKGDPLDSGSNVDTDVDTDSDSDADTDSDSDSDSDSDVDPDSDTGFTDSDTGEGNVLLIESFPPRGAEVGRSYRYRVVVNEQGEAVYSLSQAPEGAKIDTNGNVSWVPSESHKSVDNVFEVTVRMDKAEARQVFDVKVAAVKVERSGNFRSDQEGSRSTSVDSPTSSIQGTTVIVPPGAIREENTAITIGSVEDSAPLPSDRMSSSESQSKIVDFGPSGATFAEPLTLLLPLSEEAKTAIESGESEPRAWTMGSKGVWEAQRIKHIDLVTGVLVVETKHFSQFASTAERPLLIDPVFTMGGENCANSVFATMGLTSQALAEFPAEFINGLPTGITGTTLTEIGAALEVLAHLQIVLELELQGDAGDFSSVQFVVVNMIKTSDSAFDIIVSDRAGGTLYEAKNVALNSAEFGNVVSGSVVHSIFPNVPEEFVASLDVRAYAYYRVGEDSNGIPANPGQQFANARHDFIRPSATGLDDDCDRLLNAIDPTPQGVVPPILEIDGEGVKRTLVDIPVNLMVKLAAGDLGEVDITWSTSSDDGTIIVDESSLAANFASSTPGAHRVQATASNAGGESKVVFDIHVDKPVVNTPPSCQIVAENTTVFVDEAISLLAMPFDEEQGDTELAVTWASSSPDTLSKTTGRLVSFKATEASEVSVSCVANDGIATGAPGTVIISVIERPVNVPPEMLFVTPMSKTITIKDGDLATETISAIAEDPDGDAVSFEFSLLEGSATMTPATPAGTVAAGQAQAARLFQATAEGAYEILVRAWDEKGATSDSLTVKLLVVRSLDSTDDDNDGYPASIDCADTDATIYPGAQEICGDEIDQNCSGADRPAVECDLDGDGFSEADGDCDESRAMTFPGAMERCNSKDDDCDATSDEGYATGDECVVGKGACAQTGTIVCSRDGLGTLCNAEPLAPAEEICNGVDDDCNGTVDDVATDGVQSVQNCGGCQNTCVPAANQVPACEPGLNGKYGCRFYCDSGFMDLDRDPANGCEYQCTPSGNEICDGIDNDCDGFVDENTEEFFYNGPEGTIGVGQCHGGSKICVDGSPVVAMEEVVPQAELCDGMDNDCDGLYDEDFELNVACDGPDYDYCPHGFTICSADLTTVVCMESYVNVPDICDGEDNDCDPSTEDGVHDELLGGPCDSDNPDFCEPGFIECVGGMLECSDIDRDAQSCVDCAGVPNGEALLDRCGFCGTGQGCDGCLCDNTATECDSNGEGYYCSCDPDCDGPEDDCPCDLGAGCDLVDGVAECPCDNECVGENPCPCDTTERNCDGTEEGWVCVCDKFCFEHKCDCDVAADVCDKNTAGEDCFCDRDCYECVCDDGDDMNCAVDGDGNMCRCDFGCEDFLCDCNATPGMCDPDPTGGNCLCDLDCQPNVCPCDTDDTCNQDSGGGTCFCDYDCWADCFCDDGDPNHCARDSEGNDCFCDQGCDSDCNCNDNHDFCDKDSAGGECFCDWDCQPCPCDDGNNATCAIDADGNQCNCDEGCGEQICDCNVSGTCDTVPDGGPCECDWDCGDPPCNCNTTGECDLDSSGTGNCFCDWDCQPCHCDDGDPDNCATDADGNMCHCDNGCYSGEMDCQNGLDDDGDQLVDCADPDCGGTYECGPQCNCDITEGCDTAQGGGDCFCDWHCQPCPCDDGNPDTCAVDGDGNQCKCDPGCEEPMCDCDVSGECDTVADGGMCECDSACGEPVCNCDSTGSCDTATGGGSCFCDHDCDPACFCDDGNPETCAYDTDGNQCPCDEGCYYGEQDCFNGLDDDGDQLVDCADPDCHWLTECGPQCNCNSTEACDLDSIGSGDCFCDWDCQPCACDDGNPDTCAVDGDGNQCHCDPGCEAPMCDCDMTGECDTVADGGMCDCDPACGEPVCSCDSSGICDMATGGGSCFCDHDCDSSCFCDDGNPDSCATDGDGNQCPCDDGCFYGEQDCYNGWDDDGDMLVDCEDPDCEWVPECGPHCNCDSTEGCDMAQGGGDCFCDWGCQPCLCDDGNPDTCAVDGDGNQCPCDPGCEAPVCDCDMTGECDTVADGGMCDCDPACGEPVCNCDSTASCDMATGGGSCFCDHDCDPGCFCDDGNPENCAYDTDGNQCPCDEGCFYGEQDCFNGLDDDGDQLVDCADPDCQWLTECGPQCNCNTTEACDQDSIATGDCFCDWDCQPCVCDDGNPDTCAVDGDGNQCHCDPGCEAPVCDCDMTGECDTVADGGMCDCDPACGEPVCNCDSSGICDTATGGGSCFCDKDCDPGCFCDDGNPENCAYDGDGNQCPCDEGCFYGEQDCFNGIDDDGDQLVDCADPDCQGLPECGSPCNCNSTEACDPDSSGEGDCFCDGDCQPCVCDDGNPDTCAVDGDGNQCHCDPGCEAPVCDCDMSGECDMVADGGMCDCDPACGEPVCNCDSTASCDTATGGGSCFCDKDCEPGCFCDDGLPDNCAYDADGNQCPCDEGCFYGEQDCSNGLDDDGDSFIDCADMDCEGAPACIGYETDCSNGIDDDGDTYMDCADTDCEGAPACIG